MMARREVGGLSKALINEIEHWQPPSEDEDNVIAKAALLRGETKVVELLRDALKNNPDELRRITHWPLLTDMAERSDQIPGHRTGESPSEPDRITQTLYARRVFARPTFAPHVSSSRVQSSCSI
jgi:hypothetical protein